MHTFPSWPCGTPTTARHGGSVSPEPEPHRSGGMACSHTSVDLRQDVFHMVPLSCICSAAGVQLAKARLLLHYFSHNLIGNKTKKKTFQFEVGEIFGMAVSLTDLSLSFSFAYVARKKLNGNK